MMYVELCSGLVVRVCSYRHGFLAITYISCLTRVPVSDYPLYDEQLTMKCLCPANLLKERCDKS